MNYKDCEIYKDMIKSEGRLFKCFYDPETEIAFKNNWEGIWCIRNFNKELECPIEKEV